MKRILLAIACAAGLMLGFGSCNKDKTNTWEYTRLGHIDLSQDELEELLGNGDVTITLMEDK